MRALGGTGGSAGEVGGDGAKPFGGTELAVAVLVVEGVFLKLNFGFGFTLSDAVEISAVKVRSSYGNMLACAFTRYDIRRTISHRFKS